MAIQEQAFGIMWQALQDVVRLDRLIEAMTIIPRDIFGMAPQQVAKGGKAALTLFSATATYVLKSAHKHSLSINDPFLGQSLQGKVIGIINNNKIYLNK
jgi:dihydroorotase